MANSRVTVPLGCDPTRIASGVSGHGLWPRRRLGKRTSRPREAEQQCSHCLHNYLPVYPARLSGLVEWTSDFAGAQLVACVFERAIFLPGRLLLSETAAH
jgi:hypothetical protein